MGQLSDLAEHPPVQRDDGLGLRLILAHRFNAPLEEDRSPLCPGPTARYGAHGAHVLLAPVALFPAPTVEQWAALLRDERTCWRRLDGRLPDDQE